MVKEQLQARDVKDKKVLRVMSQTPRHRFVPEEYEQQAYSDQPLPIGEGQTISQPYIVGLMTQLLRLEGDEKVLEIGTGSGYQAAILAQLAKKVYTIEIKEKLARTARERLSREGYKNVTVKHGDGYKGWEEHAPFDRIILTAAPKEVPSALVDQLAKGGRMVLPVGEFYQRLKVLTKKRDGTIEERSVAGVRFVPMIHGSEEE